MATLNLGRLKPVFRSTWNSSTAYNVDDIVVRNNQSYISIQAGSNQDPATATAYWTLIAAKGSDGTDVGATLTTQGDVLYRDGSGLQRLAPGTAGQVLKTGGAAANPSWGDVAGGSHTKIAEFTSSGNPTDWALDNIFTATYDFYLIYLMNYRHVDNNLQWFMRLRTGGASGANDTNSNYRGMVYKNERTSGTETNSGDGWWDQNYYRIANYDLSDDTNKGSFAKIYIQNPFNNDKMTTWMHEGIVNKSDMSAIVHTNGAGIHNTDTSHTGLSFSAQDSSNKIANGNKAFVYGIKY